MVEGQRPPAGRSARNLWVVVVVVALVAGVAGYVVGRDVQPAEKTVVTRTVTKTVAPEPYLEGTLPFARIGVSFFAPTRYGTVCTLGGPTEMAAGTPVHFEYTARVPGSTMLLYQVQPSTTFEEALFTTDIDHPPAGWTGVWKTTHPRDAEEQLLKTTLSPGLWVVACTMNPDSGEPWAGQVYTAGMIRVVG